MHPMLHKFCTTRLCVTLASLACSRTFVDWRRPGETGEKSKWKVRREGVIRGKVCKLLSEVRGRREGMTGC